MELINETIDNTHLKLIILMQSKNNTQANPHLLEDVIKDEKGHSAKFETISGVKFLVYRKDGRIVKTRVVRKVDLKKCVYDKKTNK